jgi:hypothetical protein
MRYIIIISFVFLLISCTTKQPQQYVQVKLAFQESELTPLDHTSRVHPIISVSNISNDSIFIIWPQTYSFTYAHWNYDLTINFTIDSSASDKLFDYHYHSLLFISLPPNSNIQLFNEFIDIYLNTENRNMHRLKVTTKIGYTNKRAYILGNIDRCKWGNIYVHQLIALSDTCSIPIRY